MSDIEPPLTASESALLRQDGEFIIDNALPCVIEAAIWGVYCVFVGFAIYSLHIRGLSKSKARLGLFSVTIIMFMISTTLLILDLYSFLVQVKYVHLIDTEPGETASEKGLASDLFVLRAFFTSWFLAALNLLIGDAVILWRTWALWQDQLIYMAIPFLCWIASFVVFLVFNIKYGTSPEFPFVSLITNTGWSSILGRLQLVNWLLSMLTNLVATCMIAFKAWQHRVMAKASFGSDKRNSRAEKILLLLAESGALYFVVMGLEIMPIVASLNYGPAEVFDQILNRVGSQFFGLYPTIIIVLVELQRTAWDSSEYNSSNRSTNPGRPLSTLRFRSARSDCEQGNMVDRSGSTGTIMSPAQKLE